MIPATREELVVCTLGLLFFMVAVGVSVTYTLEEIQSRLKHIERKLGIADDNQKEKEN